LDISDVEPNLREELERLRARVAELESADARHCRAESALRESEQLYRRLVETSPDSIVLADVHGRILMANERTARLHGYQDPSELAGRSILDIVPENERAQAEADIRRILEVGELRDRQHVLVRKDGSTFVAEVTGSLVRDSAGQPKYLIFNGRDVTTRLRLQREMVESQKLESIGRLAGGIAHDFNNLLAVILGNASLQLRNQSLPPKTLECLRDVVEAAERASALTTQLLAYARGGLRRPVPSELNRLVQAACDILRPTMPKQTELNLDLAANLPAIVVDRSQIQQVIINLCMNAIQAGPSPAVVNVSTGSENIDAARAKELQLDPGEYVVLRVQDHGPGIDPATLERIFEPFFTTKPDSRGMGLPASLGIVQSHGGRLLIRSELGQGTTATVWLPAAPKDESQPPPNHVTVTNAPQGTETILVIEPDPAVSHTAEQILASLGYCVVTRNDAEQALAFLRTNCEDIDLVILNFTLPTKSGPEMLEATTKCCGGLVPVLLISGYDQAAEAGALVELGAAGFLQKPFSLMSLAQAVRKILDDPNRPKRPAPSDE